MTQIIELNFIDKDTELWCDLPPSLGGSGFCPVSEVRLVATCTDGAGRLWSSENAYLVNAQEKFHTETTAAMGDAYYGIAVEGPIYSMTCAEGKGYDFTLPSDGLLNFQFALFEGSTEISNHQFTRRTSPTNPPGEQKAQLAFFHNRAAGAKHGISLLEALGFEVHEFAISPDEPNLDEALNRVQALSKQEKPLFLTASARASEAALEIAQRVQGLAGLALFSGSGLRFSPWTLDGKTLGFVEVDHASVQPRGHQPISAREVYVKAVANRANRELGRIEVEKIRCPLYLFSGQDDLIWPGSAFSELIAQRRQAKSPERFTEHKVFHNVGHDIGPELGLPGLPTTERTIGHETTGLRLQLGGKMGRQSRARRECWDALVSILRGETPGPSAYSS